MNKQDSASALIFWNNKILLFLRDNIPTIPYPSCWHLPGGGREKGETPDDTIKRELQEEVTHVPKNLQFMTKVERPKGAVYLYCAFVDENEAKLFKLGPGEGQQIKFFTLNEASELKLTPILEIGLAKFRIELEKAIKTKSVPRIKF